MMDVPKEVVELETCAECGAGVAVMFYRDEGGWRCERCAPARRACKNQAQGCAHQEIHDKCYKHEAYFCEQGTWCYVCQVRVSRGTRSAHYALAHADVWSSTGSTWRVTETDQLGGYRLVTSPAGTAACWYWLRDSQFRLDVHIPVLSERLREFRCEVRVTHPTARFTRTYTPDVLYNDMDDWHILIKKEDLPARYTKFDVCVNISKIEM